MLSQTQSLEKKFLHNPNIAGRVIAIDQYALKNLDWEPYDGIIINLHMDQYLWSGLKNKIYHYLSLEKKIFFNGHIMKPFLDELNIYTPIQDIALADFKTKVIHHHEIYKDFDISKLNSRKGVAGFFARGGNPPPDGAKIIISIKNGTVPVDWEYQLKSGGVLYVHSGNDIWSCFEKQEDNEKVFVQMLDWLQGKNDE